ncbi:MAG: phenylalanine--tRNA ligase subunit beta [Pseudomonadota bacterium]|nr:phenylalanine--tRNA ligase subunit beta [Pseudomonadota bacterium]
MKLILSWLKEHLDTDSRLDEIVGKLDLIGLEVEGVEDKARELAAFTVAYVVSAEPHPNADKLRVCQVDTGRGTVQVVCGAPNARTGMKGVFAAPGTVIPGTGLHLKQGVIRGAESNGMLVSEREMGLSDAHEGIIEMPADAPVGVPFAQLMGLDDPVVEIAVTPNRGDCLGVRGVARDLAAAGLGRLKEDRIAAIPGAFASPIGVDLRFTPDTADACPAFAGRYVRGVRNGPSPDWLQRRLRAVGLRPISALVDITNYVMLDRSRPLHVYDADKLTGTIHARLGRKGESFLALDGRSYEADEAMCIIADDAGVLGLGGIMGGEPSGVTGETVNVFIECALFDPVRTARTGRRLGIHSDARYRFERGVDPAFVRPGMELATRLVLDLCGGEPSEVIVAGEIPDADRVVDFPLAEVKRLTGLDLPVPEIRTLLSGLGFHMTGTGSTVKVAVPSWRPDVHGKADLVEEVTRLVGVDRVPSVPLPRAEGVAKSVLTPIQIRTRRAKRTLAARGLVEAVTWSFIPHAHAEMFGGGQAALQLANPISVDMSDMRPSLLPGLIAAAQRNADRGFGDLALFEVGQVYRGDRPEDQLIVAAGLRRGTMKPTGGGRHWQGKAGPVDVFDAKADAMAVLAELGAPVERLQVTADAPGWYHPGRSGVLRLGPQTVLAQFGELHPATLEGLDADGPIAAFELFLDAVPLPKAKPTKAKPALDLSPFQPVRRDFAFVVGKTVKAAEILRAAQAAEKRLIAGVSVFDVFEGGALGADQKSVAIEVMLQPQERTLTDEEIEAVASRIVAQVEKATGGRLRA